MASEKYDNLQVMMSSGSLNWAADMISGLLVRNASFDASDVRFSETGATMVSASGPIPGRSIGADGSLLGWPITFNRVPKDQDYQMILIKSDGPDPLVLAYFDENDEGEPLRLKNNGTYIMRPLLVTGADPPVTGIWVTV